MAVIDNETGIKIKDCPFCGNRAKISEKKENDSGEIFYNVFCVGCFIRTPDVYDTISAIDRWNSRMSRMN